MTNEDIKALDIAGVEARIAEIRTEMEAEGADIAALDSEADALKERREAIKAEAEQRAALAAKVAAGEGAPVQNFDKLEDNKMPENRFAIDTVEYRDAWVKALINRDMSAEERAALTSAGAVIPTMTVNEVWDRLVRDAELLGKVDVSSFPNYVRFPVATTNNAATAQAIGTTISESSDVIGYVDLIPNEYVKLLTVGADIDHMAIDAVHTWIVNNLTGQIRDAINADIVNGTGTNQLKGILTSVNASATAIPDSVTKASLLGIMGALGANYQRGAIWIMTAKMFYENVMTITQLNDYIINDGFQFKLFGHDVVLMSECKVSSKETILYGDPKAYKLNIFKPLEVKSFETATTTNLQFRGATLADGELIDTSAFVRFAQT